MFVTAFKRTLTNGKHQIRAIYAFYRLVAFSTDKPNKRHAIRGCHSGAVDSAPFLALCSGSAVDFILRLRSGQVLQQNTQAYVPRHSFKAEVAADIRAIFNAPNRPEAEALPARMVQKYEKKASRLAN